MCQSFRGKLAIGGGVVLLAVVVVVGLWVVFKPNSQENVGDHQVINNKNQIVGLETNLGNCDKTSLVVGIVCLTVLLVITKCGILTYCGHSMLRIRRMRNEEKERVKEKFEEMKNEF